MSDVEVIMPPLPPHLATKELRREFILGFEKTLADEQNSVFGDNDVAPLVHKFCDGMYVREIFIPAGVLLTGKIHRHEHPNFLLQGTVSMITEDGGLIMMSAPQSLISTKGCKRAIYTMTDVRWVTVHLNPNGHTEICDELENGIIAKDYSEIGYVERKAVQ